MSDCINYNLCQQMMNLNQPTKIFFSEYGLLPTSSPCFNTPYSKLVRNLGIISTIFKVQLWFHMDQINP